MTTTTRRRHGGKPAAVATVAATALGMALTAAVPGQPAGATAGASAVMLTSGPSNPLQPVIDQLLDAQQQVEAADSEFGFVDPAQLPLVHSFAQDMALSMLTQRVVTLNFDTLHDVGLPWGPYPWSAPAADPQELAVLANPDTLYSSPTVDSGATYVVTVHPGPGSQDVTFTPYSGDGVTADWHPLSGGIDLANARPNPDGSYTITLSPTEQPGNWVDTAGADKVIIRDTVGDWGQLHDTFSIQQQGASTANAVPLLTDDQMSSLLSTVAANMPGEAANGGAYFDKVHMLDTIPANTFLPAGPSIDHPGGPQLPDQISSWGHFTLQPDQALIVKVPDIDSAYSSIMLANDWGQPLPAAAATGSLNDTQAFHDPDGFTYYVISGQNPGVANWVNDSGVNDGGIWLRWQNVTGPVPTTPVTTEVVNAADVAKYLPADTPTVTPAQYAADMQQRLFDYDYAQDQNHDMAWLAANLEYDQIKAALGADEFSQIFGGQQDTPSIADRLTPALSPDMATVDHDLLTDPGSLTALMNTLPLAIQDIEMPTVLAALRIEQVVEQTVQAVHGDIASGDPAQVLSALSSGVQGLETVLSETSTDPATSITAGLLNARDDLAVAVTNASDSTGPVESAWASLSDLNQELLSTLLHAGGG